MARKSSSDSSLRPNPKTAKFSGNSPSINKLYKAGSNFRRVRSPEAPKMTTVQGWVTAFQVVLPEGLDGFDGVLRVIAIVLFT
jgi:hypothetical protein